MNRLSRLMSILQLQTLIFFIYLMAPNHNGKSRIASYKLF